MQLYFSIVSHWGSPRMIWSLIMLSAWGIQHGLDTVGQPFLGKSVYLAVITSPMHYKEGKEQRAGYNHWLKIFIITS